MLREQAEAERAKRTETKVQELEKQAEEKLKKMAAQRAAAALNKNDVQKDDDVVNSQNKKSVQEPR